MDKALRPASPDPAAGSPVVCPACRTRFDPGCATSPSCAACPVAAGCATLTCPSCGYASPRTAGLSGWLARALVHRRGQALRREMRGATLADARTGDRLRVRGFADGGRVARLAAFGVVRGAVLTVRQRRPAMVVEIGETMLAFDREVARAVEVEPLRPDAA